MGGVFLSVPALLMARSAKSKIATWENLSGGTHPEAGTVKAGMWISAANIGLTALVFALYMFLVFVGIMTNSF